MDCRWKKKPEIVTRENEINQLIKWNKRWYCKSDIIAIDRCISWYFQSLYISITGHVDIMSYIFSFKIKISFSNQTNVNFGPRLRPTWKMGQTSRIYI